MLFEYFLSQGKWDVPLPKVKAVGEDEVFKVIKTGRSKSKSLGVQFFPHLLCYSDYTCRCRLASLGWCSSANKQNETVIRWRTLSKSICVVKNDFFIITPLSKTCKLSCPDSPWFHNCSFLLSHGKKTWRIFKALLQIVRDTLH